MLKMDFGGAKIEARKEATPTAQVRDNTVSDQGDGSGRCKKQ